MSKIVLTLALFCAFSWAEFRVSSLYELKNTDFVRQAYEESCGAASLANILNFFAFKRYNEKDILQVLDQKTDMLSFLELKEAVLKLGYEAQAFKLTKQSLEELFVPLLVKIEDDPRFPHFVVVLNFKGDFIKVLDPNFGTYIASKKEFFSVWDKEGLGGFALLVLPKDFKEFKALKLDLPSDFYRDKITF
ncbi:cysteine peptidase family C39 domain-containing protein [Campylobacter sp. MIT 12-5580]|uniref:C39 family peptidase n=1 Tax=Campylobacter sp. MIT 12-5580 TaxID=2040651 RepID=UPI0020178F55|nr:cysteine peptidase family C39 domain-containing protein [Campylobacter sp. MIT 12-5580]